MFYLRELKITHRFDVTWRYNCKIPDNFHVIASTKDVKVGAYEIENEHTYGIQFHPEVYHSTQGKKY